MTFHFKDRKHPAKWIRLLRFGVFSIVSDNSGLCFPANIKTKGLQSDMDGITTDNDLRRLIV